MNAARNCWSEESSFRTLCARREDTEKLGRLVSVLVEMLPVSLDSTFDR